MASDTGRGLGERIFRKLCCARGGNGFSFVDRINRISIKKQIPHKGFGVKL